MSLTIKGTAELQAAALLFRNADTNTRAAIREASAAWAPTLRQAAKAKASGEVMRRVADSGKITVTTKGLKATFGSTGKVSGAKLSELAAPYEWGTTKPEEYSKKYLSRHRISGKAIKVSRRTKRQIPRRRSPGYAIHPAVAEKTPELVTRYVRGIAKAVTYG